MNDEHLSFKTRDFIDTDIFIGNEYWTKYNNKWKRMLIRDTKDISIIIKYPEYIRVVELINYKTFEKFNLEPSIAVTLPEWYNLDDDCEVYQGEMNKDELEVPIFVFHPTKKVISMFLLNKVHLVMQIFLVFMGAKCETVNDFKRILNNFYEETN
jgi:hypothetical protein